MRKKNTIPSAFDDVLSSVYGNVEDKSTSTNMDYLESSTDVEPNFDTNEPDPDKGTEGDTSTEEDPAAKTDTTDIPKEVLDQMNSKTDNQTEGDKGLNDETNTEDLTDEDFSEAQQVSALFDAVAEKFGWNIDDIDEEHRPVTVEDLTDYLRDVVDQNSTPEYADERIQRLDEYVKNGGRFEDFYAIQQSQINYDNIDIEDETNQKTVIRELLKANGYSDQQISNKIDRYEANDMLEEEAEDALSRLKVIKQQETEELQRKQEALRAQQEEQNKKFFNDVNTQIGSLTSIRGIAIPKEDRKALFDYIFRQDANGMSQYQKDFNQNLVKNLIESAYFTMKADAFVTEAKKTGETTAAQKLRKMLRHTSKNHSSYNADEDKQKPAWEIASKFLG